MRHQEEDRELDWRRRNWSARSRCPVSDTKTIYTNTGANEIRENEVVVDMNMRDESNGLSGNKPDEDAITPPFPHRVCDYDSCLFFYLTVILSPKCQLIWS